MEHMLSTSNLRRTVEYARATGEGFPRILFVCPRQSGKTTALFDHFLDTPESMFMTTYGSATRMLRAEATRRSERDDLRPMYDVVTLSGTSYLRGRMRSLSALFIDDIQRFVGDWQEFHASTYPCMKPNGYVIATMTPEGRNMEYYEKYFNYIRYLPDINRIERSDFDRNHFDEEDFTIE